MIKEMHFVSLPCGNDICGEDYDFIRTDEMIWYQTNGYLGDRYDKVEDEIILLKLELFFYKNKDKKGD